jgi:hypothetical protein
MNPDVEERLARRADEERFFTRLRAATHEAQAWAHQYVSDPSLGPPETLEQRAGWLLAALAPSRWRHPELDDDLDDPDDLTTDDEGGD